MGAMTNDNALGDGVSFVSQESEWNRSRSREKFMALQRCFCLSSVDLAH